MSRPYPPEPHTHYCGAEGAHNSCHMHNVLDPDELNDFLITEFKQQIVNINGVDHYLAWYGPADEFGARQARLRPVSRPF